MDIVIEGNAFVSGELVKCCIGVEEGRIKAVKKILKGHNHYDFGDKLVLPGGIDAHVHFRDPGMTHKEDFGTGTMAASFGGITCVLDMPNTIPPTTSFTIFQEKAKIAGNKAFVDFGLHAGITKNSNIEELSKTAVALKMYLASTTGDILFDDYEALPKIFEKIGKINKTVCLHCEDETLIDKDIKPDSLKAHLKSRPSQCEVSAIEKVVSHLNNARIHICHVSTAEGAKLVKDANVTSEVTPHHLFLNHKINLGALGKVNPPLREMEDQTALWGALIDGGIDIIASDHAPHTLEEKAVFTEAPSGVPGVETMLPLMLSYVKHGQLDLGRLANAVSEKPGKIFDLNKGKLEVGYDADIIMVDMKKEKEIKSKHLHSKCGWTPYERFSVVFPKYTFVRGEIVIEDWELTGEKGFGENVIR
jgi:dihydroorotase